MYATDGRTDGRTDGQKQRLLPPSLRAGHNKERWVLSLVWRNISDLMCVDISDATGFYRLPTHTHADDDDADTLRATCIRYDHTVAPTADK